MLDTILLVILFVLIALSLSNTLNKIENYESFLEKSLNKKDDESFSKNNNQNFSKNDGENFLEKEENNVIITDGPINYIMTDKTNKKFYEENPINVNITHTVIKKSPKIKVRSDNCHVYEPATHLGTVTNNMLTIGHGTMTTLGSAPFKECAINDGPIHPIK
jgi:maltose-binding protein MalE